VAETRSSLAVVLRWRPYGESDKIATLLTDDFGKLTGIAKGARRSQRRFPNSLEPLAGVRVRFRQRPQATLAFLESCELMRPVGSLIEPAKFAYAGYLVELVDQLTSDGHPVPELYALLEEGLTTLQTGPATGGFLRGFEVQLLARAGYEPRLDSCSGCQDSLQPEATAYLATAHGTLWCAACRSSGGATVPVAGGVLPVLQGLKPLSLDACRQASLTPVAGEAAEVTGRLLSLHLLRPLRSLKLIAQLAHGTSSAAAT